MLKHCCYILLLWLPTLAKGGEPKEPFYFSALDIEWAEAEGRREAIYSNLPVDNYLFRVKASNNDGIWNEQETTLATRVLPPLWLRWWALGYTLLFLVLLQQHILYQRKKQQLHNELRLNRLEQEKNEKIYRERLRQFTHIAHEMRTPLMLLVHPVQEIATKTTHITGVQEVYVRIERNTQRLLTLTNNLLEIQKREAGKQILNRSTFSLREFLEEVHHSFRLIAEKRGITLRVDIPEETHPVVYDRNELGKVVFNLLSNALKFTPKAGTVTLHTEISESTLTIKVTDSGIGVGLSVARYIVEQHGGEATALTALEMIKKEVYGKCLSPESAGRHVEPADNSFMEKYIRIIKENISTPEFDIEMLTSKLGMSRAAFYRKTKATSHLSPTEMIRNIRLECAAELLKNSQKNANEIAFQVGFNSYSHFCSCFKSAYGISPAKYKDKHS